MSQVATTRRAFLGIVASVAAIALCAPKTALAADGVPLALQGAILAKALNYDQTLNGAKPKVMVVAKSIDGNTNLLAAAFKKLGAEVKTVTTSSFGAVEAGWADAVYVFSGQLTVSVRDLCKAQRVLSLSELPSEVEAGNASVAIGLEGGKPQLVINVTRVAAEGHKLSSQLLKLARVVR